MSDERGRVQSDITKVVERIAADNPNHKPLDPAADGKQCLDSAKRYAKAIVDSQFSDRRAK